MKAVVQRDFGGPEVLRLEDVPAPRPAAGEVLIRVGAVTINRTLDLAVRRGDYHIKPDLPHVLGTDPSGTVERVGPGADTYWTGQRVAVAGQIRCGVCPPCLAGNDSACESTKHLGVNRWGGYAELLTVPVKNLVPLPPNLSFAEASVIVRHFPTAFQLLGRAQLKAEEWVLVMGAAGALGSCLVQAAKMQGAHVIAGAGSDERVDSCLKHGADFGVNYRRQDLAAEVMRLTGGHGADVVFENIADPTLWPGAFNSLAYLGRLVTAGAHGGGTVPLDVTRLYLRRLQIIGSAGSRRADVERTLEAVAAGRIHAVIGRIMPLAEAAEAHCLVETNAVIGKVVLTP